MKPSIRTPEAKHACVLALGLLLGSGPALLPAQSPDASSGPAHAVSGTVLDAVTGEPLEGTVVVLAPGEAGLLGANPRSPALRRSLTTVTDPAGGYEFTGLVSGAYTLRFTRFAYRPTTVSVDVRRADRARLSIGLVVDPVEMEPVEVVVPSRPFAAERPPTPTTSPGRARLERYRQERFLSSDARSVTRDEVIENVTLAESDLFRAFQRLPGVTTRGDFTAELWTRGAPWSHTRVTFDGLPLFNPLHGVGVFSGVNADAVGAAFFHPGPRSAALAEGAAAAIDLVSRPAGPGSELRGIGELSLVSARLALDRGFGKGRGGWMLAGRRSYLDLVTWAVEELGGGDDVYVPYSFHDVTGRVDLDLGGGNALEASVLWEQDDVRGDVPDILENNPSRWGNLAARTTIDTPIGGVIARHTIGLSRFSVAGLEDRVLAQTEFEDTASREAFDPATVRTDHSIQHVAVSTSIEPLATESRRRWVAGATIVGQDLRYDGPAPMPHPGPTSLSPVSLNQSLTHLDLWGERRWSPTERLTFDTGARFEIGGDIPGAEKARFAPRLTARYAVVDGRVTVSAGWSRVWQYTQVLAPTGPSVGPRLHPSDLWFLASDSIPALRADVITTGGEAWLGERWLAGATLYRRAAEGMTVPDPTPGTISESATFVVGRNVASGLELSLRRLYGGWTASLGYTYGRSRIEAAGRDYPASSERRHLIDAVATLRLEDGWRLGAAYSWASGAPYTRFFSASFSCRPDSGRCEIVEPAVVGEPNRERGPAYSSLDVLIDWTRDRESWSFAVFGQVRNLLDRENALTYTGARERCEVAGGPCDDSEFVDTFDRGLPILPAVGLRFSF